MKKNTTLTKADISETLCEKYEFNKKDAKNIVEDFFEKIRSSLQNGDSVKISGFGNFDLRVKRERPGRNPKTGDVVMVSARRVVTFKAGQKLRGRVEHAHKS